MDSPTVPRSQGPLVQRLLSAYCKKHDLTLVLDNALGHAGYIQNRAGNRSFFVGTRFDLNAQGACELVRDKAYALEFLKRCGFSVPGGLLVSSPASRSALSKKHPNYTDALTGFDQAISFANKVGFPLFAKPNNGQEGRDVFKICNEGQLKLILSDLFSRHDKILLQETVYGQDLRVLVLDGDILCVIERMPPSITGDGLSSIEQLMKSEILHSSEDPRVLATLEERGFTLSDIPSAREKVPLLPTSNLSSGGTARIVTESLPAPLAQAAIACGKALGLSYFGADILVDNPASENPNYRILELNSAPGLSELYRQDAKMAEIVVAIYEILFDALRYQLDAAR
ncbi:ATP-dependent carboxylate-amine ligase [Roseibium algae]|uniref:ATP-dependent carboxylate-amine ligase n=1 Tax=Roseibium algae TaxID=3123038 RepID=A0ABU8TMS0_9HYPH